MEKLTLSNRSRTGDPAEKPPTFAPPPKSIIVVNRVFLDTNVVLSFYFNDAEAHQQKAIDVIFQRIVRGRIVGYVSPICFYQLLHFIDKQINNPTDFFASSLPVIDPLNFVLQYINL